MSVFPSCVETVSGERGRTRCESSTARCRQTRRLSRCCRIRMTTCATPVASISPRSNGSWTPMGYPIAYLTGSCGGSTTTPVPPSRFSAPAAGPRTRCWAEVDMITWSNSWGARTDRASGSRPGSSGWCSPCPRVRLRRTWPTRLLSRVGGASWPAARLLARDLRRAGLTALIDYDGHSSKSQMKRANRSGARRVLILGEDELARRQVTNQGDGDRAPAHRCPGPGDDPLTRCANGMSRV